MATESCPACILLVEDDDRLREAIGAFLESRGYPTTLAASGEEAFDQLAEVERPCLVLVDLLTLSIDCAALLAMLGPHDRVATIPMVLVSVSAPGYLSRPAVVKRPPPLEILFRVVEEHCCRSSHGGGRRAALGPSP
jgi:CheY-like chemotaxis protein